MKIFNYFLIFWYFDYEKFPVNPEQLIITAQEYNKSL